MHCLKVMVVVAAVAVGTFGKPEPLSNQQQLRRRGVSRGRTGENVEPTPTAVDPLPAETTEPIFDPRAAQLGKSLDEREKQLTELDKNLKVHGRDEDLDARGRSIDKQVLETDKRLKEREGRIAAREKALGERESEIMKLAEAREQEIDRLTKERENAAELREKALEDREKALQEREKRVADREERVHKRMEANRKRFQRRRELRQLDERIGVVGGAKGETLTSSASTSKADITSQATTNHPRRVVEMVTFRKVTSAPREEISVGGPVTTSLSTDENTQVTEAVAYESAKEYVTPRPSKGDSATGIVPTEYSQPPENSLTPEVSSLKKRKGGKRRGQRQRRQGHEHHRKHKVRKVVKKMTNDGPVTVSQ
ncbi:Reticulocyte-binding protein 2 a [Orchesella cincta]|uniref:Reticulocyte-binding protein 2 a n=1 Tax=Orchesella cincta TaxID=48709 RepID=A0A1D2MNJ2_ORCCI|nr:Reticulocyte-binding protein 2 a [Orchesella cincta]